MRSSYRGRSSSDGSAIGLAFLLFALVGIITFQAVRALTKANTRDYRPRAYDVPRSSSWVLDFLQSLGMTRIVVAGIALFSVAIGVILLFQTINGTLAGRSTATLIAVIALWLIAVFLSFAALQVIAPFVSGGFILAILTSIVVSVAPSFALIMLSVFVVGMGVILLTVSSVPGQERELYRVWAEISAVAILVTVVIAAVRLPAPLVLVSGLLSIMLLATAVVTPKANDTERLLPFLGGLLVVIGTYASWSRPNSPLAFIILGCGGAVVFLASLLRARKLHAVSRIPAEALTTPIPHWGRFQSQSLYILPGRRDFAPQQSTEFVRKLLALTDQLTLSIIAQSGEGIVWAVSPSSSPDVLPRIENEIATHAPGSQVIIATKRQAPDVPYFRQVLFFALVNDYAAPLPTADQLSDHDPLTILTQRMSALDPGYGERVTYQVVTTTTSQEAKTRAFRRLQQGKITPLAALWQDPNNPIAGLNETQIQAKLNQSLYHSFVVVIVESREWERLPILLQAARDVEGFSFAGHNRLVLSLQSEPLLVQTEEVANQPDVWRLLEYWKRERSLVWRSLLCVLSPAELAALWHLPSEEYESREIAWSHGDIPDAVFEAANGVPLGETTTPGMKGKTLYLHARDRRTHHYIAGMPDAGKSTLMLRLIQAYIAAGHGLAVIDPHRKLIADIVAKCIPDERRDDVVLLEMQRADFPVPLNPFRVPPEMSISNAMQFLLFALRKIYDDIWLIGQTENYITNAVQLLLTDPDATPLDIFRLFQDGDYRSSLVSKLQTADERGLSVENLIQFWEFFDGKSSGEKDKILSPIINRTQAFSRTGLLELMMCHPYTLDYRKLMSERKIVLIDLSGNDLRQDSDTLATLLVSGFFLGAFSLGEHPDDLPPRFYLYVDEIERAISAPFKDVFSESRKYGLSAILANQFLNQIPEDTLKAIIGTVGTKSIFQVGVDDAHFLAPYYEPVITKGELLNLDLHKIAVRMRRDKKTLPPIVLATKQVEAISSSVTIEELRAKVEKELLPSHAVRSWLRERRNRTEPTIPPQIKSSVMGGRGTVEDFEPND